MIAIAPEWIGRDAVARVRDGRARCSTRTGSRCTRPRCRRWPRPCSPRSPPPPRRTRRRPACSPRCCPSSRPSCTSSRGSAASPGLSTPAPSFGQHVASLAPGSAFGVVLLARARRAPAPRRRRRRPGAAAHAPLAARRRAARASAPTGSANAVNPALGDLEVRRVEPTPGGPSWWGTAKLVEAVAYPLDVQRARRRAGRAARPVDVPLVPRAGRPLALPAVRPPRPPGAPQRSSARSAAAPARALARRRQPRGRHGVRVVGCDLDPRRGRRSGPRAGDRAATA